MTKGEKAALRRMFKLIDGYLSELQQDTLMAHNGGMMTVAELRQHIKAAIALTAPSRR